MNKQPRKKRKVRTKFASVESLFAHHVPTDIIENLKWRKRVYKRVLEDPDYIDVIRETCSKDPIFWMNGFGWTYDTRRQPIPRLPFILYPFQREVLLDLINATNNIDILVEKSRDMGASWLCVSALTWCWMYRLMQSFLFVSRVEDYVDKPGNPKALFWKFDFLLEHMPSWLRPIGYDVKSKDYRSKMHALNPENGSVIDGESTTGSVARGDRRTAILLDEFAAVEQGHRVLASTRDATPCRIFNSTPEGVNNAFYDTRQKNIKKLRLHWSSHPSKAEGLYTTDEDGDLEVVDADEYPEDYIPILDGKLRSPWYDLQCERAADAREIAQELDIDYLGSGHQFFNPERIQAYIREFARPPTMVGDLEYDELTAEPIEFRESPTGNLRLWFFLDRNGNPPLHKRYSIGHDVSAGTGSSNSVISAWDCELAEKVLEYSSPFIRPEQFAKQSVAIARWLRGELTESFKSGDRRSPNSAYMVWESNGPGRQFGSRIVELGYSDIYFRKREEAIDRKTTAIPGWAPTKEGKLVLMGYYRNFIEKQKCINRSKDALNETLEFVFDPRGGVTHSRALNKTDPSGAGASHGDRVMADALGLHGVQERTEKPKKEEPEIPVGSLAWRNRKRQQEAVVPGRELGTGW